MILADENVHYSLIKELRNSGIEAIALVDFKRGLKDSEIVEFANCKENIWIKLKEGLSLFMKIM